MSKLDVISRIIYFGKYYSVLLRFPILDILSLFLEKVHSFLTTLPTTDIMEHFLRISLNNLGHYYGIQQHWLDRISIKVRMILMPCPSMGHTVILEYFNMKE